jgi:hypothetical protein
MGYTALSALTLLECGNPKNDAMIQGAATQVRSRAGRTNQTYELALCILFLDKLGDPKDGPLIQSLALRLVAGQTYSGGWNYQASPANSQSEQELLSFLQDEREYRLTHLSGKSDLANPLGLGEADLMRAPGQLGPRAAQSPRDAMAGNAAQGGAKSKKGEAKLDPDLRPPEVPASLRHLAIFNGQAPKQRFKNPGNHGDNSNTQFALLALWAARRHEIPLERTFALAELRFRRSQKPDGGWGYNPYDGSTDTMTCVGLLGLAVGRGTEFELLHLGSTLQGSAVQKLTAEDDGIQKGLKRLGRAIGAPAGRTTDIRQPNLYFLWSVERVAVLYGLPTIGNKNWYQWGAETLLANQHQNGSWSGGQYHQAHPVIDTCFALLFLKRANLAPDLSDNLRRFVPVVDPDRRSSSDGK